MNTCTSNFLQKHDSSGQVEDPYVVKKMKAKFKRNFQQRVISWVSISEMFFRNIFYRKNSSSAKLTLLEVYLNSPIWRGVGVEVSRAY